MHKLLSIIIYRSYTNEGDFIYGQSVTVCCNARTIKLSFVNRKTLVLLINGEKKMYILCVENIRFLFINERM